MALNLDRLFAIARGEQVVTPVTGVTALQVGCNVSVTRVVTPAVTSQVIDVTPVTCVTPQKDVFGKNCNFAELRGVTGGVTKDASRPIYEPNGLQAEADRRNRNAIAAGFTDRFCACGLLATVAVFDPSPARSNSRWLCCECFDADRERLDLDNQKENDRF